MQRLQKINLVLLIVLGLGTSVVKFLAMPEEMALFSGIGFSNAQTMLFGAVQFVGTLLLFTLRSRPVGAALLLMTFIVGTIALFNANQMPFAPLSLVFIAMAALAWRSPKRTLESRGPSASGSPQQPPIL